MLPRIFPPVGFIIRIALYGPNLIIKESIFAPTPCFPLDILPFCFDTSRPAVAENQPVTFNKNRMTTLSPFSPFIARLREFIGQSTDPSSIGGDTDSRFKSLALELFALQFSHNSAYRRLCESRKASPDNVGHYADIPAMPTTGFKELEVTSLSPEQRNCVFHSSGTTEHRPSRHFHDAESLSLYEASLLPWFRAHVLDGWLATDKFSKAHLIFLTPPPEAAPNSSLVYMFSTIRRDLPLATANFVGKIGPDGGWTVDVDAALVALREAIAADRPVMLLGTAFGFVHLLDWLAEKNLQLSLPGGSRVLETGGYKGRSRTMQKAELHALITQHLGITPANIVSEYGMSELSSQAYDAVAGAQSRESSEITGELEPPTRSPSTALRAPPPPLGEKAGMRGCSAPLVQPRIFHFPPWARTQIVSPETGREVAEGETGLIRIFDLANVRSVLAIQTEDLGVRRGAGFELLGRAALAEPRGCSLMSL